jgi:hypothetical protein
VLIVQLQEEVQDNLLNPQGGSNWTGGAGGSGSGGQLNFAGTNGTGGITIPSPSTDQGGRNGGVGGGSLLSPKAFAIVTYAAANTQKGTPAQRSGVAYGGGGTGGYYNSNNPSNPQRPGGAGKPGVVIVEY